MKKKNFLFEMTNVHNLNADTSVTETNFFPKLNVN